MWWDNGLGRCGDWKHQLELKTPACTGMNRLQLEHGSGQMDIYMAFPWCPCKEDNNNNNKMFILSTTPSSVISAPLKQSEYPELTCIAHRQGLTGGGAPTVWGSCAYKEYSFADDVHKMYLILMIMGVELYQQTLHVWNWWRNAGQQWQRRWNLHVYWINNPKLDYLE